MTNETNNADKLLQRIRLDAAEEISKLNAEADSEIKRLNELSEHDIWEIEEERAVRIAQQHKGILERSRTNAELDSRKYTLSAKRKLLDSVFTQAAGRLAGLEGPERDSLLTAVAIREADGGEKLLPDVVDAPAFARLLDEINAGLKAQGKAPVTLGEPVSIGGGFLLAAPGYEKNCSFAAMLREVREREESSVAGLLSL